MESRKRDLEQTLTVAHDDQAIEPHPNMADLYRKKVSELQMLLTDEAARPQAMEIIRLMIERIEVSKGQERGKPDVVLVGALAQILTFTQKNKTAASNGSGGRVLMVAGVGNRLNFLLFMKGRPRLLDGFSHRLDPEWAS